MTRDWSQLPLELLSEIYTHLNTTIDQLYFRSVCPSWRHSALQIPSLNPILHLPNIPHREIYQCFLHAQDDNDHAVGVVEEEKCTLLVAYRLVESSINVLHSGPSSKNPFYQAWLFKVYKTRHNVFRFLNPLFRTKIKIFPWMFSDELDTLDTKYRISGVFKEYHLEREEQDSDYSLESWTKPSTSYSQLSTTEALQIFDRFILKRVVLSPTATIEDYVIMAIHPCGLLILLRSGDTKWTVINGGKRPAIHDVIHYKGNFYAVDSAGGTFVVDLHTLALTQLVEPFSNGGSRMKYLVESDGELFLLNVSMKGKRSGIIGDSKLWRNLLRGLVDFDGYSFDKILPSKTHVSSVPVNFAVYKLHEKKQEWAEVKSLGDRIFLVGERSSFSISKTESLLGCQGNCIIFADFSLQRDIYFMEYGHEMKQSTYVFKLENNSIHTSEDYPSYSRLFWPPPDFDCAAELRLT